ncbi:hypothetical protein FQR65_LT11548 [Abscondita terminalis]|nr:hypothetical protein FQR65_LT11548 [Abscondita terminalis]
MGGISTSFVCGRKPILVNLIGVDGAGKTTILYKYKLGFDTPVETIHTIGFNVEVIKYKNFSFQITDFGGGDKVQPIISRITKDTPVLIFVIDSSDRTNQRLYLQWEEFRVVLYAEGNQYSPAYVVGMDGAGKTTILYKNKFGFDQPIHANPTIGFNIEVIKYKNFSFQITDFGGGGKIQPMNARLCKDLPVLIFVIDSSDRTYDHYSKDRLSLWMEANEVEDVLLLVFANKQDLPGAFTAAEIIDHYKLEELKCRGESYVPLYDWFSICGGTCICNHLKDSSMGIFSSKTYDMDSPKVAMVKELISSDVVVIFSKTYCPYCNLAKDVFKKINQKFTAIELDSRSDAEEIQYILGEMTGAKTVPRVFVKGECLGGGSDVKALYDSGKLKTYFGDS